MSSAHKRNRIFAAFLFSTSLCSVRASIAFAATALPNGDAFVAGTGQITAHGNEMTINQSSSRGVIDWRGFSIGAGNSVQFNNGSGATMNRVTGGQISQIDGRLGATGSVFLINPNGIVVGPHGQVVTNGSFVASTRNIDNGGFNRSSQHLNIGGVDDDRETEIGSVHKAQIVLARTAACLAA